MEDDQEPIDERSRDIDADLTEITSRLGEPLAVHRTNPTSVAWRFIVGVIIVLAVAVFHYLVWTGEIPWPAWRHIKLLILMLAGLFVVPGIGLYLIGFAVAGRRMWVLDYPTGLFLWHRGRVVALPWDEIVLVQITGLPDKAKLNRPDSLDEVWYDLKKSGGKLFGTAINLGRADGEMVGVSSILTDFSDLGERIQRETFRRLFPKLYAQYRAGDMLSFGPVLIHTGGITVGKDTRRWSEIATVERVGDKLAIKIEGKKKPWKRVELNEVMNLHVLMGIVSARLDQRLGGILPSAE